VYILKNITIYPNAKLNFGLNIINKRDDGYHNIDSIFVPIDLQDEMKITFFDEIGDLTIKNTGIDVPTNKKNIIYKVYEAFYEKSGFDKNKIEVNIEKKIPIFSGLGGGSSDGAFFLRELNKYHNNYFKIEELIDLSSKIGADIPFFIFNKAARINGIGDKIKLIQNNFKKAIILIKPNFGVSTKFAYENVKNIKDILKSNLNNIESGLKLNQKETINENIKNILQQALFGNKDIKLFEDKLNLIFPKKYFHMSGSGSCFFTICEEDEKDIIIKILQENFKDFFIKDCKLI